MRVPGLNLVVDLRALTHNGGSQRLQCLEGGALYGVLCLWDGECEGDRRGVGCPSL